MPTAACTLSSGAHVTGFFETTAPTLRCEARAFLVAAPDPWASQRRIRRYATAAGAVNG
jgi:hypothetical protein